MPYYGLFMEQGTGKTKVIIDTLCYLWGKGLINRIHIIAPKGVHTNWKKELDMHLWDDVHIKGLYWNANTPATLHEKLIYNMRVHKDELLLFSHNPEILNSDKNFKLAERFLLSGKSFLIIDESFVIKNYKAKRTKKVISLGLSTKYRRILTGTPVANNTMDLQPQMQFLEKNWCPYTSYWTFRMRYAEVENKVLGNRAFTVIKGEKNLDELNQYLSLCTFSIKKKDCLDLPDKVFINLPFEMEKDLQAVYTEMQHKYMVELEEQEKALSTTIAVTTVLSQIMKLQQIASGFIMDEMGNAKELSYERVEILSQIIDANDPEDKFIIWAVFHRNISMIETYLDKKYPDRPTVRYTGTESQKDRERAIEDFQNGDAKFFIATSAAARGLTLTACHKVIYFNTNYSLETFLQSQDRNHRIGQENKVTYHMIRACNTVEENIHLALTKKKKLLDSITDWKSLFEHAS